MPRVIFHIDVNSAFLSWTAVKLLSEGGERDIRTVPSVVSGDPDDRRSIIAAASIPAKKMGIKTAMPLSTALRTCPSLVVVKGDWEWYSRCSVAFISICRTFSPVLQQFSIDECFLDMTGRIPAGKDPVEVASALKDRVRDELGFTVNVGVGPSKLLAKMASDFEKPDKVHTLWEEEVPEKMWPLRVRDLLWVGKKTEEKLTAYGINTIGQLSALPESALKGLFGDKFGTQLYLSSHGIDPSPVETQIPPAKSYSAERTFVRDITDAQQLDRELFKIACTVCHRLRKDSCRSQCVSVFLKESDFSVMQKQMTLDRSTDVTAVVLGACRKLVEELWDTKTPLRQAGISLSKLSYGGEYQLYLFEDPKMEYYLQWDREYDEKMARSEDPRTVMLQEKRRSPGPDDGEVGK